MDSCRLIWIPEDFHRILYIFIGIHVYLQTFRLICIDFNDAYTHVCAFASMLFNGVWSCIHLHRFALICLGSYRLLHFDCIDFHAPVNETMDVQWLIKNHGNMDSYYLCVLRWISFLLQRNMLLGNIRTILPEECFLRLTPVMWSTVSLHTQGTC